MSNVYQLPFEDISEIDATQIRAANNKAVQSFMEEINDFCEGRGVNTTTEEYRHQAAVIMTQLQVILMGLK